MNTILDKYKQDIEDSFNAQKSIKTNSLLDNLKIAGVIVKCCVCQKLGNIFFLI